MTTKTTRMSLAAFIVNVFFTSITFPGVILLAGGNWRWLEGWIFALWMVVMILFNMIYLYRKDPALLTERTNALRTENQKHWDRYLQAAIFLILILWLIVLPLDAQRFHWSPPFPVWLKVLGGILLIPALYLIERATMDNTFLSAAVRIQSERKQQVVSSGVYGFVRHPLYLGCLLLMLGAPLMVGSIYGLLISVVGAATLVGRIIGEEKMLRDELDGYEAYQHKVRYRLIPFLW